MNPAGAPVIDPDGLQGAVSPEWANRNPFRSLSVSDVFGHGMELTAAVQRKPYNKVLKHLDLFAETGMETVRSKRKKPKSTS